MLIERLRRTGVLEKIAFLAFVLNVVDGLLTITWIELDLAQEANPMLDRLLDLSPVLFMLVKTGLVFAGLTFLTRHLQRVLAVASLFLAFGVYSSVIIYHLTSASRLLFLS